MKADDLSYQQTTSGRDEPQEMWITGETAIEFQKHLGQPPVDAHGDRIDKRKFYYLSRETGLVPA